MLPAAWPVLLPTAEDQQFYALFTYIESPYFDVASDAFASLASLHSLQLNRNDLEGALDPRIMRPLAGLSTLGLGHNRIQRVAPDTFKGCTQVSGITTG